MSVVIIIGGGRAHAAITNLEQASLLMDSEQRACAEQLLADFSQAVKDKCSAVSYPAEWPE